MDEIKSKFLDLIQKQNRHVKIPSMGFDYFAQPTHQSGIDSTDVSNATTKRHADEKTDSGNVFGRLPDQEILDGTEEVYFQEDANCEEYELMKFMDTKLDYGTVERAMLVLKQQHKVVSKRVLQNILDQRSACNDEFERINETRALLDASLTHCRQARHQMMAARSSLTVNSLEILATYKKRETLHELLTTLRTIQKIRLTERRLQEMLAAANFSGAIGMLLECRAAAADYEQYRCVEALSQKLQDTMHDTELQLDTVLNEQTQCFETSKYAELQAAYKLLGKSLIAMDQLHLNFTSAIHTTAFKVLRKHHTKPKTTDEATTKPKMLFEQICESIPADKYIACFIELCKSFWSILVCYYQVTAWHQNVALFEKDAAATAGNTSATNPPAVDTESSTSATAAQHNNEYVQQKFKTGQLRLWNDIQAKCCVLLASTKLHQLKYEQFIQVLSVVQRLKKVGVEFCGDTSTNLMDSMRTQSVAFFQRYHATSLEEICLFVDNESWMPVASFSSVLQLQEFRQMKASLQRYLTVRSSPVSDDANRLPPNKLPARQSSLTVAHPNTEPDDQPSSIHSQDGGNSSIYGSCGYFYRFAEKSSPFDGGFDETMLEEDILAGIADESSCYFSEESEEERGFEQATTARLDAVDGEAQDDNNGSGVALVVSNASLNVLRCIGRYLQMCRLLHSISPNIVASMTELIDFYTFVVHDVFGNDLPVPRDNLYTTRLAGNLRRIGEEVIPKVRNWPPTFSTIHTELCNADSMFGMQQRAVAVESAVSLVRQFTDLHGYLAHLLPAAYRTPLQDYLHRTGDYIVDLRSPVFMCVTARAIELQNVLSAMAKVRWDINHVNVEHSGYVDTLNRGVQMFAMRLEEFSTIAAFPKAAVWESLAHVLTHTLVEGYANAKKCTAAGRALMQLDFAHFMSILELTSGSKHPVHRAYVDTYIKAYYMPPDLLSDWCRDRQTDAVYSNKQLSTLVQAVCANDKKTRQRLLQMLDHQTDSLNASFRSDNGTA